jgi:ribose 1,5-bisphosphokinase
MSLIGRMRTLAAARAATIGPGHLVLVVGPSGAGKDTLIELARDPCRADARIVFPQRVVTRPSSAFEAHEAIGEPAFSHAVAEGAFALWWRAHGLGYGVPRSIEHDIREGRTVVCNASRAIVEAARDRFANVTVVLVTAPADVRRARLAARGRGTDGEIDHRVNRVPVEEKQLAADVVIDNVRSPEAGAQKLLAAIRSRDLIPAL